MFHVQQSCRTRGSRNRITLETSGISLRQDNDVLLGTAGAVMQCHPSETSHVVIHTTNKLHLS